MLTQFWLEHQKGKEYLEDLGVDALLLTWIIRKDVKGMFIGFVWLRIGAGSDSCEHYNETSGNTIGMMFRD
jgi:hypothetical protein